MINLVYVLFLLFPFIGLYAKVLEFKPGQKAHYFLDYSIEGSPLFAEPSLKSAIELNIRILEGDTYPFTVEIDLKKAACDGVAIGGSGTHLEYFIGGPDQVEELTGGELHPVIEFSLKAFLGQLFQLCGGNVMPDRSYRLFSYYLLHDLDDPVYVGGNHYIKEDSALHVDKVTNKEIEGQWLGFSYVRDQTYFEGRVDVDGTIRWNLKNPLVQQRRNTLQLIEINRDYSSGMQSTTSIRIKQRWKSS